MTAFAGLGGAVIRSRSRTSLGRNAPEASVARETAASISHGCRPASVNVTTMCLCVWLTERSTGGPEAARPVDATSAIVTAVADTRRLAFRLGMTRVTFPRYAASHTRRRQRPVWRQVASRSGDCDENVQ